MADDQERRGLYIPLPKFQRPLFANIRERLPSLSGRKRLLLEIVGAQALLLAQFFAPVVEAEAVALYATQYGLRSAVGGGFYLAGEGLQWAGQGLQHTGDLLDPGKFELPTLQKR